MNQRIFQLFLPVAGLLLLVGVAFGEGLSMGVIVGTPLVLASVVLLRSLEGRMPANRRPGLVGIFVTAVILRWIVATGVHLLIYQDRPGLFAPDETYYEWVGEYGAAYLAGRVPPFTASTPGISWVMAACYLVFGKGPLLPKLLNGIAGGWCAVLTALIALEMYAAPVARRAGFLVALLPSLVLWGSLNTKDNAALLGAELTLYAFMRLRESFRPTLLLPFAFGCLCILTNRSYEMLFVAFSMAVSMLFLDRRHLLRNLAFGGFVTAIVVVLLVRQEDSVLALASDESTIERVLELRVGYAGDQGSAVNLDLVDTSTTAGLVAWLPFGLAYFFLAPIPFVGTSAISLSTSPEMIVWYLALPSLFRGVVRYVRRGNLRIATPVIVYVLASSIGWSMAVTNVGSLYRYRAQVLFLPLIFIAADMVRRQEEQRRHRMNLSRPADPAAPTRSPVLAHASVHVT